MAQSKNEPSMEAKSVSSDGWTTGKILTIAGGAVVGVLAADILIPGLMMKTAIGLIGGGVLGYYWYSNELAPPMGHRASDTGGAAKVVMTKM